MDEKFGSLIASTDVEEDILEHFRIWMDTYLAARERKKGMVPGSIARPRSYIIKRRFTTFPGEEQTPLIALISDGWADPAERHGTGIYNGFLRVGIGAVVMAAPENEPHRLVGHYESALINIAIKHRKINDQVYLSGWNDLSKDDLDEEATGRTMSAVRFEFVYKILNYVSELPALTEIPDVPYDPQPDDPIVETTHVEVNKV